MYGCSSRSRRSVSSAALAAVLAAASAAQAEPALYRIEPQHSFVHFALSHFDTSTLRGRFGPVDGFVEMDRIAGSGSVGVRIRTASVDTGVPVLDQRLREPDLLATTLHPEAYYVSTRFVFDGGALVALRGEFTLRGVSQPLELRALRFGCRLAPERQREVCGGDFEGELRRGDFGLSYGMPFVANRVRVLVQVQAVRE